MPTLTQSITAYETKLDEIVEALTTGATATNAAVTP